MITMGPTTWKPGWRLACALCGRPAEPDTDRRCPDCAAPILAERTTPMPVEEDAAAPGIFRWSRRLGLDEQSARLSLGEGNTPLVAEPALAERARVGHVLLKLDTLCPTGSFKDRSMAAAVAHAVQAGSSGLVCASSGNAAASSAAYGARAGLPTFLVTPSATPRPKLEASAVYGAVQVLVPGDYSESFRVATMIERELGLTNVATTYVNPSVLVGLRSMAYELAATEPDVVIVPTSAGPLVHGVYAGFVDLVQAGLTPRVPRIIAAQPEGCAPIVRAFDAGVDAVTPWEQVSTSVSGLNDPLRGYAEDGTVTLDCIRRSAGAAIAVADKDIYACQTELAEQHGVFTEPAGATAIAALQVLADRGLAGPADTVVCLLTGHGSKQPPPVTGHPIDAATVDDLIDTLRRVVDQPENN